MKRRRLFSILGAFSLAGATIAAATSGSAANAANAPRAANPNAHVAINCEYNRLCPDLSDPVPVFGSEYVGHDEPSNLFYSDVPGSGNHMTYSVRLPRDPSPANPNTPGKSYQFELNGSMWFGMALCATQSYPEQLSTCTPDSDSNIVDPAVSDKVPGAAFLELQFYAPGWVPWPTWQIAAGASGCDPTKWCVAMNIFNLAEDPVHGTVLNSTCAAQVGGLEYFNFAFLTRDGRPTAPPNPVDSTTATFTPDPTRDLFMNSGDNLKVSLTDSPDGLRAIIRDLTSGQTGSMTASAANGFAQVKYDPTGTSCVKQPYNFHPMFSTSSEKTRIIWAAHSYNVAFASEIGHFEHCEGPNSIPATPFGVDASGNPITCPAGNTEGFASNASPTDADDDFCFPASEALLVHINGCTDTNTGFDSLAYQAVWPDGNTALHPQPMLFSSPKTGEGDNINYSRTAFEANLPRNEPGNCRFTGQGCLLNPLTDKGTPVAFYPFFSAFQDGLQNEQGNGGCFWGFGNDLPGATTDFGRNTEYGSLLASDYLAFGGGGKTIIRFNNFRQVLSNPCTAGGDNQG